MAVQETSLGIHFPLQQHLDHRRSDEIRQNQECALQWMAHSEAASVPGAEEATLHRGGATEVGLDHEGHHHQVSMLEEEAHRGVEVWDR